MMPQRVMIIGGPGAGKTWLARRIGERLGLPVIAIDDFVHDSAGRQREANAIDADARRAASGERWIIEGGNTRTYEVRLERADWLIRLRPPVALRLWRVMRRGNATPSLLRWTWAYDRVFGPRDDALVALARDRIRCDDLRTRDDVAVLLHKLSC